MSQIDLASLYLFAFLRFSDRLMDMKHILVTGGAGFIGSHLCDRLINEGHRVTCVDNYWTGAEQNIAHLLPHSRFTFLKHDVQTPFEVDHVDQIFHLASPASPKQYRRDPLATIKTNVWGTSHLLDLAKRHGARFLQASTSEVYGDSLEHPQAETYFGNVNPVSERACYDESKRCAETLCLEHHRIHQTDVRIIRIFNTYGPRLSPEDGRVVSNFIIQALRGEPLTVYHDGSYTRCFQYVDDLIDGFLRMMDQSATIGPVNLGNPHEITIKTLAELIIKLTGSSSRVVCTDPIEGYRDDVKRRKPDISLAQRMLGWEPRVSIEDGLKHTIRFFRENTTS